MSSDDGGSQCGLRRGSDDESEGEGHGDSCSDDETAVSSEEFWENAVSSHTEENLCDMKVKEGKAVRNWALAHGVPANKVDLAKVAESDQGLGGWASAQITINSQSVAALPPTKPARPSPKAKATDT